MYIKYYLISYILLSFKESFIQATEEYNIFQTEIDIECKINETINEKTCYNLDKLIKLYNPKLKQSKYYSVYGVLLYDKNDKLQYQILYENDTVSFPNDLGNKLLIYFKIANISDCIEYSIKYKHYCEIISKSYS